MFVISLIALVTNYFSFYNNTVLNNMLYGARIDNKELIMYACSSIINHEQQTVQRKTTIISFTCIAEIDYIHKVIHSNTQ